MDWREKITVAMALLKEGCKENTNGENCFKCPFEEYCMCIMENFSGIIPEEFKIPTERR